MATASPASPAAPLQQAAGAASASATGAAPGGAAGIFAALLSGLSGASAVPLVAALQQDEANLPAPETVLAGLAEVPLPGLAAAAPPLVPSGLPGVADRALVLRPGGDGLAILAHAASTTASAPAPSPALAAATASIPAAAGPDLPQAALRPAASLEVAPARPASLAPSPAQAAPSLGAVAIGAATRINPQGGSAEPATAAGTVASPAPRLVVQAPEPVEAGSASYGMAGDPLAEPAEFSSARLERPAVIAAPMQRALPTPGAQIAVHIVRAVPNQIDQLMVRLEPAELGEVEIRLEFRDEGRMAAAISAERPETLHALQRDSGALERSLQEAGLRMDQGGLSFSLKRDQARAEREPRDADGAGPAAAPGSSDDASVPAHADALGLRLLDIRA